jgi:hypothetical protein
MPPGFAEMLLAPPLEAEDEGDLVPEISPE